MNTLQRFQALRRVLTIRRKQALEIACDMTADVRLMHRASGAVDAYDAALQDVERQIDELLNFAPEGIRALAQEGV